MNTSQKNTRSLGFTLLETMLVVSIVVIVIGSLSGMAIGLGDTARVQGIKTDSGYQARRGMIYIVRDLRHAALSTVNGAPGALITYQVADDIDGNGTAVNISGDLELSPVRTIGRDMDDANGDGLTDDQVVMVNEDGVDVMASDVLPNEDNNGNGILDAGEDINGNGILDRGIWFDRTGNLIEVTIQTGAPTRRGRMITFNLTEVVRPRN